MPEAATLHPDRVPPSAETVAAWPRFIVQVGRDARVYYEAVVSAPDAESLKTYASRHGFRNPDPATGITSPLKWTHSEGQIDVFDNVEVINIVPTAETAHLALSPDEPNEALALEYGQDDGWFAMPIALAQLESEPDYAPKPAPELVFAPRTVYVVIGDSDDGASVEVCTTRGDADEVCRQWVVSHSDYEAHKDAPAAGYEHRWQDVYDSMRTEAGFNDSVSLTVCKIDAGVDATPNDRPFIVAWTRVPDERDTGAEIPTEDNFVIVAGLADAQEKLAAVQALPSTYCACIAPIHTATEPHWTEKGAV